MMQMLQLVAMSVVSVLPYIGTRYLAEDFQFVFDALPNHALFPFVILFCIIYGVVKDLSASLVLTLAYAIVRKWYLKSRAEVGSEPSESSGASIPSNDG